MRIAIVSKRVDAKIQAGSGGTKLLQPRHSGLSHDLHSRMHIARLHSSLHSTLHKTEIPLGTVHVRDGELVYFQLMSMRGGGVLRPAPRLCRARQCCLPHSGHHVTACIVPPGSASPAWTVTVSLAARFCVNVDD